MTLPASAQDMSASTDALTDRRRHQRVGVALLGRYMLTNRMEYPCRTIDISPGGASIIAPVKGVVGERVVAYLEHLGRVEGKIARLVPDGFAMAIVATPRKREKLAAQLTWLANRHDLGLPEDRRFERIVPTDPRARMTLEDGRSYDVRLIDISTTGAAIATEMQPSVGMPVTIGATPARIVRHFASGIAVEFTQPIASDLFDENLVL